MGSKNKLKRFKENEVLQNVIQPERKVLEKDDFSLKGNWSKSFFKNDNPIVLELGCGKGEYTVSLAAIYPEKNFIGIDIKGARLWRGAKNALKDKLKNVAFIRTQIELINSLFLGKEVSEIWLTFPDPQIKYKRDKLRLTNPNFLNKYKNVLIDGGLVHLKTDSEFLYGYTLGILKDEKFKVCYANHDIYKNPQAPDYVIGIQTFYEKKFISKKKSITYIKFKFN